MNSTHRRSALRRLPAALGVSIFCLGAVLGVTAVAASADVVTFSGFEATGTNSFSSGGELKPKCPEGILATPGSDPAAKRLGDDFDPETFEPGDAIPYLYLDFTTAEESTFKLQDCVVSFPEDFFVDEDFDENHQLVNDSFKKSDLAKAATELDAAELLDFVNTTANGEEFTYSWNSPEDLDAGLWICNIARDVAVNHGNQGDSDEVGNRKVSPVCFQVPGGGPEPGNGITVVKTNDANGDDVFHDTETAPSAGADVDFQFTIHNDGEQTATIEDMTDAWPGHEAADIEDFTCVGPDDPEVELSAAAVYTELPFDIDPGDTVTCTFTVEDYAPSAGGSVTNTVDVTGHAGEAEVSDDDTSVVNTPAAGCQRNCGSSSNRSTPPVDMCSNLAGIQADIPPGLVFGPGAVCSEVETEELAFVPEPEVLPEVITTTTPAPAELPFTGNDNGLRLAAIAASLMALGGVLMLADRRRLPIQE